MTAVDQVRELADHPLADLRLTLLSLEREQVAAEEHLAIKVRLQRAQNGVLAAGKLGGDIVG
jgi:hypothetical protein